MKEQVNEESKDIKRRRLERGLIRRRGERMLRILEILSQGTVATLALMAAFAPGTTYGMARSLRKLPKEIRDFFEDERKKNQFYCLLSYLQKTGLVSKKQKGKEIIWTITNKGREKRNDLTTQISKVTSVFLPIPTYKAEKSDKLVVVIFDIPEKEKFKRDWLRNVLKILGLSLIQKSVWMGHIKIPPEFLEDLKKFDIFCSVKIFSVVEIGNLD